MDEYELFSRLGVALAIGLLVGLERGWQSRDEEDHQRAAGFRTFALSGLLGGIAGLVSVHAGGVVIGLIFLGYTAAFVAFHWLEASVDRDMSVTSVVAGMVTFLLGCLAIVGDLDIAIAAAVAMTALLALREQLHRWLASLTWHEIRAVLILLAMSFLLLPILPNRTIDPWNAINPYEIWLLAILIAAVSFAGYVAVRAFGDRLGVILAAIAGGVASSTATTLALARLGREHPTSAGLISAGILIAGVVMIVRVGIVAMALNGALLPYLLLPLAVGGVILALGAVILLFGNKEQERPQLQIDNPLALGTALRLAAFIAGVMLATEFLRWTLGPVGALIVAGISGVADADAVTISMARLGGGEVDLKTAGQAILIAVAVNTTSKAALAAWGGGRKIGALVGAISAVALAGGALAIALMPSLPI